MNHKELVNKIRQELIKTIREAVEKENNCIGTFYKNKGCRHSSSQIEDEYDNSPVVVVHNTDFIASYGDFEPADVVDLYVNTELCLMCTVNGFSCEDWDEPVENVQTEGLIAIVEWLQTNGFIQVQPDNPYRCANCGSTNVQIKAWVLPNKNNEYVESIGSDREPEDNFCEDCNLHTKIILENELLHKIDDWWKQLGFYSKEKIAELWMFDYDMTGDCKDFLDDCNKKWNEFTTEQKIEKWINNKDKK